MGVVTGLGDEHLLRALDKVVAADIRHDFGARDNIGMQLLFDLAKRLGCG